MKMLPWNKSLLRKRRLPHKMRLYHKMRLCLIKGDYLRRWGSLTESSYLRRSGCLIRRVYLTNIDVAASWVKPASLIRHFRWLIQIGILLHHILQPVAGSQKGMQYIMGTCLNMDHSPGFLLSVLSIVMFLRIYIEGQLKLCNSHPRNNMPVFVQSWLHRTEYDMTMFIVWVSTIFCHNLGQL